MRSAAIFVTIIVVIWFVAICCFFLEAMFFYRAHPLGCDNVVVLTGGKNRIIHALKSAKIDKPKNIFISGVYEKSRLVDIVGNMKIDKNICFTLGRKAKNTSENASEISDWVRKHGIKQILLITSDYHMRRSITELKYSNDMLKIIPYSSKSDFDMKFVANCAKEFHKTIFVLVKNIWECVEREKNEPHKIGNI